MTEREFLTALGIRVRVLRAVRGVSQREVAEVTGIHRTVVGKVERGQINFGVDYLRRLAQALDTAPARLVPPVTAGDVNTAVVSWDDRLCDGPLERPPTGAPGPCLPDDLVRAMDDAPLVVVEAFLDALELHAGVNVTPEQLWEWWDRVRDRGPLGQAR